MKYYKRICASILGGILLLNMPFAREMDTVKAAQSKDQSWYIIEDTEDNKETEENIEREYEKIYETEQYKIVFQVTDLWEGGHQATICIENKTQEDMSNWNIQFQYPTIISEVWNAVLMGIENDTISVKAESWNTNIPAGGRISFGIKSERNYVGCPDQVTLSYGKANVSAENCEVTYEIRDRWNEGCSGSIFITNNTDKVIEDWILTFNSSTKIQDIWNAVNLSEGDELVRLRNSGYNYRIGSDEKVEIGFNCSYSGDDSIFSNFAVYQYEQYKKELENNTIEETEDETITDTQSEEITGDNETSEETTETTNEEQNTYLDEVTFEEVEVTEEDLGEIYYKDFSVEDIEYDEDTYTRFVKDQVIVSAYWGIDKQMMESFAESIDAKVVGFIELVNYYQLEFKSHKTIDELNETINYLENVTFIESVSLNWVSEWKENVLPYDKLFNDNIYANYVSERDFTNYSLHIDDEWGSQIRYDDTWGLKALNIPKAWDICNLNQKVKIGILDSGFSEHEDLPHGVRYNNQNVADRTHGTCVAGIIGAKWNNIGIAGVVPQTEMFTYTAHIEKKDKGSNSDDSALVECYIGLVRLIGQHVKVINRSIGINAELVISASQGDEKAVKTIIRMSDDYEKILLRLDSIGYNDYIIVTSAGNENDVEFVEDKEAYYGYRLKKESDTGKMYKGGIDAMYVDGLAYISNPILSNRIIVVGAVEIEDGKYQYASFSNIGSRVTVCAPGVSILTTTTLDANPFLEGYQLFSGTSAAAPYITGLIGLMYEANPNLSPFNIKRILQENSVIVYDSEGRRGYYMPDAEKCCIAALNDEEYQAHPICEAKGTALGAVLNSRGSSLGEVNLKFFKQPEEGEKEQFVLEIESNSRGLYCEELPEGKYTIEVKPYDSKYLSRKVQNVIIEGGIINYLDSILLVDKETFSAELAPKRISGHVMDKYSGYSYTLMDATVYIRKGLDNKDGEYLKNEEGIITTKTDTFGNFTLEGIEPGDYTLEIQKEGYQKMYYNVKAPLICDGIYLIYMEEEKDADYTVIFCQKPLKLTGVPLLKTTWTQSPGCTLTYRSYSANSIKWGTIVARISLSQGDECIAAILENRYADVEVKVFRGDTCVYSDTIIHSNGGRYIEVCKLLKNEVIDLTQ